MVSDNELDVLRLSLELGLRVSKIVDELENIADKLNKESGKKKEYKPTNAVRARVDSFPQLVASSGLIPALTFYMSKCSDKKGETKTDMYEKMYELISSDSDLESKLSELSSINKKALEEELKEGGGYNIVTAALAYVLWKIATRHGIDVSEPRSLVALAELLNKIRTEGKSIVMERYMLNFAQSFKKVIDALIKKE